jgi:hypothetical protein
VERVAVAEGAAVTQGANQAVRAGGRAAVRGVGVGVLAADGETFSAKALHLLPDLLDLPVPFDDDDDTASAPLSPEITTGALLERVLRSSDRSAPHVPFAPWGEHPGERVIARGISRSPWATQHDLSRSLPRPTKLFWLAPRTAAEHERMLGARPTPAEGAVIEAGAGAAAAIEAAGGGAAVTSNPALVRAITASDAGSALLIAGWSRPGSAHLALRDGTSIREGDIHAACFTAHLHCFVLRQSGARGDPRGAFAGADTALAMAREARAQGQGATGTKLVTVMLDVRARSARAAAIPPEPPSAAGQAPQAQVGVEAPRPATVSLTALVGAEGTTYLVRSDSAD